MYRLSPGTYWRDSWKIDICFLATNWRKNLK